jgi:dTMP kinase
LPTLTFVLDLSPAAAAGRMQRELDRMESQGETFQQRLRAGFLAEAFKDPQHIVVLDAARNVDEVQADIRAAAGRLLTVS